MSLSMPLKRQNYTGRYVKHLLQCDIQSIYSHPKNSFVVVCCCSLLLIFIPFPKSICNENLSTYCVFSGISSSVLCFLCSKANEIFSFAVYGTKANRFCEGNNGIVNRHGEDIWKKKKKPSVKMLRKNNILMKFVSEKTHRHIQFFVVPWATHDNSNNKTANVDTAHKWKNTIFLDLNFCYTAWNKSQIIIGTSTNIRTATQQMNDSRFHLNCFLFCFNEYLKLESPIFVWAPWVDSAKLLQRICFIRFYSGSQP